MGLSKPSVEQSDSLNLPRYHGNFPSESGKLRRGDGGGYRERASSKAGIDDLSAFGDTCFLDET